MALDTKVICKILSVVSRENFKGNHIKQPALRVRYFFLGIGDRTTGGLCSNGYFSKDRKHLDLNAMVEKFFLVTALYLSFPKSRERI